MNEEVLSLTRILWDYMCMHQELEKADFIIGFGCYNEDVARRAAQLYRLGYAPKVIFTGALGRNTLSMWTESEAIRFSRVAMEEGVPEEDIILEQRATNSGENLIYSRSLVEQLGFRTPRIIGVQKPYMERRLFAAFPVYWPEADVRVTSWQQTMEQYMEGVKRWGRTAEDTVHMIVGDLQRMELYAKLGYQIPQHIPDAVKEAFTRLVELGYTNQLCR